jgi:superfamily II DNA or RNA helicase
MIKENQILIKLLDGVTKWSELKIRLEDHNTSQTETTTKKTLAGRIFECFSKYYFLTDPEKKDLYRNVWHYEEIPQKTKEVLKLPNIDHGIDILLEDLDGKFHAVQCKFKNDESKSLSWSGDKIANVFALGTNCEKIIIFSNTSDVTKVAKAFTSKYEQILNDTLLDLPKDIFEKIHALAKGNKPTELKKYKPLEHQKTAISKVVNHLNYNDRGQLILPCGAGKTLTSLWIKEALNSKTTLVLVPSLALLKQIKNDWARHKNQSYRSLYVCSEKDINKNDIDTPTIHTYEIGGPVTTKANEIKSFIERDFDKIIFSTYQSIGVVSEACLGVDNFTFDLIICDEAHRTAGSSKKNTFTLVHDNQKLPSIKRLYMTATPKVASASLKTKLGEDYSFLCDMSNPEIYGTEAYRMSFWEAIEKGILVDYKIVGIGVTDKEIKKYIQEREFIGQITAEDLAHNFALNLVMNKYEAFHGLTFHSKVILAQEFAKRHEKYFDKIYAESVNGKQTTTYRKRILDEFKNSEKGIVSNARCLTEGVDVPTIDLIYFCDPKSSKIDIVQASGRALRKDPTGKKKQGLIVVPIFHHIDQDVEKEISNNPIFNYLIQVVRSLCDQDERLEAEINKLSSKKGKRSNSKIQIDFSEEETERIIKLEGLEKKIKDTLFDIIIEKNRTPASRWKDNFEKLQDYYNIHGNSDVPARYKIDKALGSWVVSQRVRFKEKRLNTEQIANLNSINFNWSGNEDVFELFISRLKEFKSKYGHTKVPIRNKEFPRLGTWTNRYRVVLNNGELDSEGSIKHNKTTLTKSQIQRLEELGFSRSAGLGRWDDYYEALLNYKQEFGNTSPNQKEYPTLYGWIIRVRTGKLKLTKEQRKKLELIDFNFEGNKAKRESWEVSFNKLKEFKNINGHCKVSRGYHDNSLANFVARNRYLINNNKISIDKLNLLNSIGFNSEHQQNSSWEKNLSQLKNFFEENGTSEISSDINSSLYSWILGQRAKYKKGLLTKEQIDRLNELKFNWSPRKISKNGNDKWDVFFAKLLEYKKAFGHVNVPQTDSENKKLGRWLNDQRVRKNGKLSGHKRIYLESEKIQKLTDIGVVWDIKEHEWDLKLKDLEKFYIKHGHFNVKQSDKEFNGLYYWVYNLRKKGTTRGKIERLSSINFPINELKVIDND